MNFGSVIDNLLADIRQSTDYSPFGVKLKNRNLELTSSTGNLIPYRYGFNGKEKDDEIKGSGNSYDFGARMYDSRLGRWFSRDAHESKYPSASPYNFVLNNPITSIDPDGKDVIIMIWFTSNGRIGHTAIAVENYKQKVDENNQLVFEEIMGDNNEIIKKPVMEKTGTYQYYDFWPATKVNMGEHQKNREADYNSKEINSFDGLVKQDPSISGEAGHQSRLGEDGNPPDAVFRFKTTDFAQDEKVMSTLNGFKNKQYHPCDFNCTSFAINGLKSIIPEKVYGKLGQEYINLETVSDVTKAVADKYGYESTFTSTPNALDRTILPWVNPSEKMKSKEPNMPQVILESKPAQEPSSAPYLELVK